jgi:hypothetical protein
MEDEHVSSKISLGIDLSAALIQCIARQRVLLIIQQSLNSLVYRGFAVVFFYSVPFAKCVLYSKT